MATDYSKMSVGDLRKAVAPLITDPHLEACLKSMGASVDNVPKVLDALVRAFPDKPEVIAWAKAEYTERGVVKPGYTADKYINEIFENAKMERAYIAQGTGYKIDASVGASPASIVVEIGGTPITIDISKHKSVGELVTELKTNSSATIAPELFDTIVPGPVPSPVNNYVDKVVKYEVLRHSKPDGDFTPAERKLLAQLANEAETEGRKVDAIGIPRTEINRFLAPHIRECARANGITKLYDGDKEIPAEILDDPDKLCDSNALDTYNRGYYAYFEKQLKYMQAQENTDRLNALSKFPAFNNMVRRYQEQLAAGKAPFINPFIVVVPEKEENNTANPEKSGSADKGGTTVINNIYNGERTRTSKTEKAEEANATLSESLPDRYKTLSVYAAGIDVAESKMESRKRGAAKGKPSKEVRYKRLTPAAVWRANEVSKQANEMITHLERMGATDEDVDAINGAFAAAGKPYLFKKEVNPSDGRTYYTVEYAGERFDNSKPDHISRTVIPSKLTDNQALTVACDVTANDAARKEALHVYNREHTTTQQIDVDHLPNALEDPSTEVTATEKTEFTELSKHTTLNGSAGTYNDPSATI